MDELSRFEKIDLKVKQETEKADRRLKEMKDEEAIKEVLQRVFPQTPIMRITSLANDLAQDRQSSIDSFLYLIENDLVNIEAFNELTRQRLDGVLDPSQSEVVLSKFIATITCSKEPMKHIFPECRGITCLECVQTNLKGLPSYEIKVEKSTFRRSDVCTECGDFLDETDELKISGNRIYYTCSHCGHKGWNQIFVTEKIES